MRNHIRCRQLRLCKVGVGDPICSDPHTRVAKSVLPQTISHPRTNDPQGIGVPSTRVELWYEGDESMSSFLLTVSGPSCGMSREVTHIPRAGGTPGHRCCDKALHSDTLCRGQEPGQIRDHPPGNLIPENQEMLRFLVLCHKIQPILEWRL